MTVAPMVGSEVVDGGTTVLSGDRSTGAADVLEAFAGGPAA
jgi:hypothetical protein